MVNMNTRVSLILLEQMVAILIFVLCAGVTIQLLVVSHSIARESQELRDAMLVAKALGEGFVATAGDLHLLSELLGVTLSQEGNHARFHMHPESIPGLASNTAFYAVVTEVNNPWELRLGQLTIHNQQGAILVSFPVAARRGR